MDIKGSVALVTGGGSGIGRGMCERFASLEAGHVFVADINADAAAEVADAIGGTALSCDVTDDASVRSAVDAAIEATGRVDLLCANAGLGFGGDLDVDDDVWDTTWQVNVMGVVRCARAVIPHMEANGGGNFLITASAAGLTTGPVSFNYATTKHAVIGVAEWLALNHGPTIKVGALCPTIVDTPMMAAFGEVLMQPLSVEEVVDSAVAGLVSDSFLITPHASSVDLFQAKAADWDGFLTNMQQRLAAMGGD